jgi:hypothetical protein
MLGAERQRELQELAARVHGPVAGRAGSTGLLSRVRRYVVRTATSADGPQPPSVPPRSLATRATTSRSVGS